MGASTLGRGTVAAAVEHSKHIEALCLVFDVRREHAADCGACEILEPGWRRVDAARLAAIRQQLARELAAGSGPMWDRVAAYAEANGLDIVGGPPAVEPEPEPPPLPPPTPGRPCRPAWLYPETEADRVPWDIVPGSRRPAKRR